MVPWDLYGLKDNYFKKEILEKLLGLRVQPDPASSSINILSHHGDLPVRCHTSSANSFLDCVIRFAWLMSTPSSFAIFIHGSR